MINFSGALNMLKIGSKIQRQGWNGKGMFLLLVKSSDYFINDSFSLSKGLTDKEKFEPYFGQVDLPDDTDPGRIELLPWIGMKTADNKFIPWLASQSDILAEDWQVFE